MSNLTTKSFIGCTVLLFFLQVMFFLLVNYFELFSFNFFTDSPKSLLTLDEKITIFKLKFTEEYTLFNRFPSFLKSFLSEMSANNYLDKNHRSAEDYLFLNELNDLNEIETKAKEMAKRSTRGGVILFVLFSLDLFLIYKGISL